MVEPAGFQIEDPHALEERLRKRDRRRLLTAFTVAALLHAGTAFAIAYSRPPDPIEPPGEMTITIDLAPAMAETESATAGETESIAAMEQPDEPEPEPVEEPIEETPPERVEETPPEPVEEVVEPPPEPPPPEPVEEIQEPPPEVVEQEPPPEPLPEPPPEEIVETPPPPPAEEAVVAMPPPPPPKPVIKKPVVEKPKPKKPEKPKPVKRAERPKPKPSQASAASAAAASTRQRSEVAGSGARATPNEINRYTGRVRAAIERRKRRPSGASGGGTVHVSFTILASGQVTGVRVTGSSGNPALDAAARDAVTSASIPPIPAGMAGRMNLGVPIRFNP
ncbi:energy transducer TonB family protein [Terrihabitans sp. B22-R8]|uniref:energy transducer TonB family protein n=1 Tax=Terrihabitans sp. B22-R8 TaxID=3425128 RepID=UPI00403C0925